MNHGETPYSPDYKSEKPLNSRVKIRPSGQPYVDAADLVESRLKRLAAADVSAERSLLERTVIETSKAARLAEHEHTKALTVETWEAMAAAQVLRDSAVDDLLAFEQEKKS